MNQREATFNAISKVTTIVNPMTLSDVHRKEVLTHLVAAFMSGQVDLNSGKEEKMSNPNKMKSYCIGLLNDFLRKDKRVNGGEKYEAKNPGSRSGNTDETVRELRKLKKSLGTDTSKTEIIDQEIEKCLAETVKAKAPKIDYSKIPANIMGLISK